MIALLIIGLKIITSMIIAIQDMKTRMISIYLLIGLFVINFVGEVMNNGLESTLQLTGINTLLLGFIFGFTFLYFKFLRKVSNPLITHLGWGDILFFIALTPLFSPIVYSYVFIGMTALSTIIGLILYLFKKGKVSIPHAGISALFFIAITMFTRIYESSLNSLLS